MTHLEQLEDGGALTVTGEGEIGEGPWARLLASAIVPDPRSARAQRGLELARAGSVHAVAVGPGAITGKVVGSSGFDYEVELHTRPLPPRVWEAALAASREHARAGRGEEQSVRLEHELAAGWGEPLVPQGRSIRRSCTCPDAEFAGTCKHLVALAFALAEAVDRDPRVLLRWRGCEPVAEAAETQADAASVREVAPAERDPWTAGRVPDVGPPRALPVGAVLKRLGPSGLRLDGVELVELLEPAYVSLSAQVEAR